MEARIDAYTPRGKRHTIGARWECPAELHEAPHGGHDPKACGIIGIGCVRSAA